MAASNENFDAPLDDYDQKLKLGVGGPGGDMKNRQNEKAKLAARYLNGIAIAIALAGP